MRFLITGGSGYFGGELKRSLLRDGHHCVNMDIQADGDQHPQLISEIVDITNQHNLQHVFEKHAPFDAVFHIAAQLQLTRFNRDLFYATNVDATDYLMKNCIKHGVKNIIYISSNCVYGKINNELVAEETSLQPFEEYGKTKVAAEAILKNYQQQANIIIFRPPTIIGEGRLGVLSIVFDFIRENRRLYIIGSGENRYQFIYSEDLIKACKLAAQYSKSAIFNIGSDQVPSLNELFGNMINMLASKTRLCHLPALWTVPAMKLCFRLGISPLGPYQYNMLANTYIGDTRKIKRELSWQPTKTNLEILLTAYDYYIQHREKIINNKNLSGHRKMGRGGIISLIKWIS